MFKKVLKAAGAIATLLDLKKSHRPSLRDCFAVLFAAFA